MCEHVSECLYVMLCFVSAPAGSRGVMVRRRGRRRAAEPPSCVRGAERGRGRVRPAGPAAWTLRFWTASRVESCVQNVLGSRLLHRFIIVPFVGQKIYTHQLLFFKPSSRFYTVLIGFVRKSIFKGSSMQPSTVTSAPGRRRRYR